MIPVDPEWALLILARKRTKDLRIWDLQIKVQRNRKQFWIPSWSFKNYGAANMQTKDNKYLLPRHLALLQRTALSTRSFNIRLPSLRSFNSIAFEDCLRSVPVLQYPPWTISEEHLPAHQDSFQWSTCRQGESIDPGHPNPTMPQLGRASSSPNTQPERKVRCKTYLL